MTGGVALPVDAREVAGLRFSCFATFVRDVSTLSGTVARLVLNAPPPGPGSVAHWFDAGIAPADVPRAALDDCLMVLRVPGDWTLLDEVALVRLTSERNFLELRMRITSVESADGDPAPASLYLSIPLNPTIARLHVLRIVFSVERRSFDGAVSSLDRAPEDFELPLPGHRATGSPEGEGGGGDGAAP